MLSASTFKNALKMAIRDGCPGAPEVVIIGGCPDHKIEPPEPSAPYSLELSFCRICGERSMSDNPMHVYQAEREDNVRSIGAHSFRDAVETAKVALGGSVEVKLVGKCPKHKFVHLDAPINEVCEICGHMQ
ncbi:hypothetical protein KKA15_02590 [Patescibacteria group bacterium]|nr:hypothetical protein [Patescibacteria group bacterium]